MTSNGGVRTRARAQLVAVDVSVERAGRPVLDRVTLTVTAGTRLGVVGENGRGKSTLLHAEDVRVAQRLTTPVSVALTSGDRLLVTGPNGAGKSTLLAVLAGRLPPDEGRASIAPSTRIGLVAQESPSPDQRRAHDAYEARLQELRGNGLTEAETVPLGSLGLLSAADLARPVADLSMGQQRRLDLALALAGRPHVLLLDEPTNHLSIALVDELTSAFETTGAVVVVVTHDRQMRRDLAAWPGLDLPGSTDR